MISFIFLVSLLVLLSGLFIMITSDSYLRKIIGLSVFQSSILIFYIALGKIDGGTVPIVRCFPEDSCSQIYSSPLPHVLMLTAIVVGFATCSVGYALILRIKQTYGTISEREISEKIRTQQANLHKKDEE